MKKISFNDIYHDPIKMALAVVGLLVLCQILFFALSPLLSELIDENSAWVVSVAMMLFYVLFNSISTFADDNLTRNWSRSIYGFGILGAAAYLLAWLISGKALGELDGFRDIILIVIIGFVTLRTIATTIMIVVLFTKMKDANKK
jgi:hypothetical protein